MNDLFAEYNDVMTVTDLAKALQISSDTAYQLLNSGEIPCKRVGRQYRICKSDLIQYIRAA